ncbi:transferase [Apiospora rasikravindrae]|uniref:Transferase n=1 Tax=Apiospora rasikravindrae TaxID=990691 RepID=A0ABR1S331_9PEZI
MQRLLERVSILRRFTRSSSFANRKPVHSLSGKSWNSEQEIWRLGDLEYLVPPVFLRNQWVYKIAQQTNRVTLVDELRSSLSATLEQCRTLSGVLVKEAGEVQISTSVEQLRGLGYPPLCLEELASLDEMDNLQTHGLSSGRPILQVQTTWIPGGLILTVGYHHYSMDGMGFAAFLNQWRDNHLAMGNGGHLAPWHPENLNRERLNGIPIPYQDRVSPITPIPVGPPKSLRHPSRPIVLNFHEAQRNRLKSAAAHDNKPVSSYSAITALLWRVHTPLSTAVNLRSRFKPPLRTQLQANAVTGVMSPHVSFAEAIAPGGLTHLSSIAHEAALSFDVHDAMERANKVAMLKDKTMAAWTGAQLPEFSFAMTDMRNAGYYELDFGFGAPLTVRNVHETQHPCVIRKLLPGTDADGIHSIFEVQMPVEDVCLEQLVQDSELLEYAEVASR